ncbi:TRAP transporter large permease [Tuberibacillus sp. Marseille-P3662]|uniref:TRAP transporter large permease n=1 Tax=Tuberibacillus sp. Marseille-P3662 TaxID=1965358 RepID=UPI000A1CDBA7|nr:TRAP transporter large permease [Tuberibacillus sp. Marseille-P3662]
MGISILIGCFILLIMIRVPIALALIVSSLATGLYLDIDVAALMQRMVGGLNAFSLIAIPFFILAGEIMNEGGISRRLINFSNLIIGKIRGGLAMVNVLTSTFFGGISGSSVADTSSVGSVMIPMMKKKGYDTDYSVSVTVSSAAQGVIIPPSHNMIIYSMAAGGVSIGSLFIGGLLPGIILGLALMITTYIIAVKRNYPKEERVPAKEVPRIVSEGLMGLLTPIIIIGGIVSGVFTATESAAIAAVYAFIITFFVYRDVPLSHVKVILFRSVKTLSMVLFLIAASSPFGWLLAYLRVPAQITEGLVSFSDNPIVILLLINIILLMLGMIMDMAPLILIATPILLPVVTSLGMDPVHFGVLLMLNLSIGLITPPVGSALFVGSAIGKLQIEKLFKSLMPFYITMIIVLLIVTFVPQMVMFLPDLIVN